MTESHPSLADKIVLTDLRTQPRTSTIPVMVMLVAVLMAIIACGFASVAYKNFHELRDSLVTRCTDRVDEYNHSLADLRSELALFKARRAFDRHQAVDVGQIGPEFAAVATNYRHLVKKANVAVEKKKAYIDDRLANPPNCKQIGK